MAERFEIAEKAMLSFLDAKKYSTLRDMLTTGSDRLGILAMLLRQFRLMQHIKIMQFENRLTFRSLSYDVVKQTHLSPNIF